jgi:hypothetical protein
MASSGGGGGGGGGAKRNVVWCDLHPETSEVGKTMGREGNHNNNTRARKGAKVQLPKLRGMIGMRHAGLWGEV